MILRSVGLGLVSAAVLVGCGGIPKALKEAPPLARAASCQVGGQNVVGRPDRTPIAVISMNNDGNWCWMDSTESQWGRTYGPWLAVTKPPQYGKLRIDVIEGYTRVAYQPNPGFVGTDAFQTRSETLNNEVNYDVNVTR